MTPERKPPRDRVAHTNAVKVVARIHAHAPSLRSADTRAGEERIDTAIKRLRAEGFDIDVEEPTIARRPKRDAGKPDEQLALGNTDPEAPAALRRTKAAQ